MEEVMLSWRDRGRGGHSLDGGGVHNSADGDVSLPLGPGEWEEGLGLPLCVVCQNVSRLKQDARKAWLIQSSVRPNRSAGEGKSMERRSI